MKKTTFVIALLCLTLGMYAIPARRATKTVRQSDGTELLLIQKGDESFHYYCTLDGVPVVREDNGDYSYAALSAAGRFVSTGCLAHNEGNRSEAEATLLASHRAAGMDNAIAQAAKSRRARYEAPRKKVGQSIKPKGTINVPVLLVQFADEKFTYTKNDCALNFNGTNYTAVSNPFVSKTQGSLRDYFISQSDSMFVPNFIVTDIITLNKNMAYYGGNNTSGDDKNVPRMIIEACQSIDADFDFSIFDNDGDGTVEFLYCLYAGYAEAAGAPEETIWPHQWYLSAKDGAITLDGVKIDCYACSSELSLNADYAPYYGVNLSGIGACCHEFSHCLGLPDFYDTGTEDNFGMDYWSVMDYGCYNVEGYVPLGYGAYERDFMGWRDLPVLTEKGTYEMKALTAGGHGYKIINEANDKEYYVVENRQQEGWDTYIFNSGMLITHVDYDRDAWYYNTVNTDSKRPRFTIIPADNDLTTYYTAANVDEYRNSLKGDPWPGTAGNTELTDYSTPAATVYTGGYMGKPIRDISEKNGVVTFSFLRGLLTVPVVHDAIDITETGFTASWDSVEDATKYIVALEKVEQNANNTVDTLLFEDFQKVATKNMYVMTPDSYMTTSGWTSTALYTAAGMFRLGSASTAGMLTTPQMDATGEVTVSFAAKLHNANDQGVVLTAFLVDADGNETEIISVSPTETVETHTLDIKTNGLFSIKLSTENATGSRRAVVDDITIVSKASYIVTPLYTVIVNGTTHTFSGLENNCTYRYCVQAGDETITTAASEHVYVTTYATGIDSVEGDNAAAVEGIYDLMGRKYDTVTRPGIYIVNGKKTLLK